MKKKDNVVTVGRKPKKWFRCCNSIKMEEKGFRMKIDIPENVESIHFFTKDLCFPVAVYSRSKEERTKIEYMKRSFDTAGHTTGSLCIWCIRHHVEFQIMYPIRKVTVVKNPYKALKYLQLKNILKKEKNKNYRMRNEKSNE